MNLRSRRLKAVLAGVAAVTLTDGLAQITQEFKSYEQPDRTWTPLQSLTASRREQLDGSLGALLEQLSLVPDLLDLPIRPDDPND